MLGNISDKLDETPSCAKTQEKTIYSNSLQFSQSSPQDLIPLPPPNLPRYYCFSTWLPLQPRYRFTHPFSNAVIATSVNWEREGRKGQLPQPRCVNRKQSRLSAQQPKLFFRGKAQRSGIRVFLARQIEGARANPVYVLERNFRADASTGRR